MSAIGLGSSVAFRSLMNEKAQIWVLRPDYLRTTRLSHSKTVALSGRKNSSILGGGGSVRVWWDSLEAKAQPVMTVKWLITSALQPAELTPEKGLV